MDPSLHSSHRSHSRPKGVGPSRFGDKQFARHQPRSSAMTQLPSMGKLNYFERRVTPRKRPIEKVGMLCKAHVSDTINLTVESLTLSDKRYPLMGNMKGIQLFAVITLFATALAGCAASNKA